MGVPEPLAAAVAENARWCDRVGRAAGVRTAADARRWWSTTRMPPLHPDAMSLVAGLAADELLSGVALGPSCSVKDSHADVALDAAGFGVVHTGRWWHRPPGSAPATSLSTSIHALGDEVAGGVLAGDPDVRLVVVADGSHVLGRAVLHEAGEVVGVSNLSAEIGREVETWTAVVAAAAGRHLVGWERDGDLEPALAVGCRSLGALRVWLARAGDEHAG